MLQIRNKSSGALYHAWQVPARGEAPSEEMIDWLGLFDPDSWAGDDEGIVVYDHTSMVIEEEKIASPGDYVVCRLGERQLRVLTAKEVEERFEVLP